jgi:4-hydroxy-tetrahydrodipicolinate synthase
MAEKAAECGAQALVIAPPYYFPAGQPELLEYLQHLVPRLPLPVFLYNMPSHTKVFFEPGTVKAAAEIPGIIGLKDSSGNMIYFHQLLSLLSHREAFAFFIGAEELLAESLLLGGHGGICGGANLVPRLYVELFQAAKLRDWERVSRLHHRAIEISTRIYRVGRHPSSYLKGLKCALGLAGICGDFMAEPFHRFRLEEQELVRQYLEELGILGKADE